jgi:LPS-assembly protein
MFRLFFFFCVLFAFGHGSDKVEIYSSSIESQGDIVVVKGEVSVVYKDHFLHANSARYDKASGELELFGNIRANQGSDYKLLGDYAKLNIAHKERVFQPFFMHEKTSDVWISGDEGYALEDDLEVSSGVMSGCDPNKPLWKMEFSSSDYNADSKWLNLYNTRIYIYDIPVFYTPYFGYSLDTTRRTGLLTPALGISNSEGFYYEQPIYIAEQNWWDLELKPQLRTERGYGGYATFRFVDTKNSKGSLSTGYFKEKKEFFEKEDLAYDSHYGYRFLYNNNDLINSWFGTSLSGESGLYIDLNNMNDVDYINLASNDTTQYSTATQVLSRVNMFYNADENYFGVYVKHYKDLTLEDNDNTLQQLPTFQYHHYLDAFFDNHLLYNIDFQSKNYYREINKRAIQSDLNIPVKLHKSLFDEYLNVAYTAQVYGQHSSFHGDEQNVSGVYNTGVFVRNSNIIDISSHMTKAYDEFLHVIDLSASYIFKGSEYKDGFYDDYKDFCADLINQATPQCEFYEISTVYEDVNLGFSQFFFDSDGTQLLYHKLLQNILYEDHIGELGELENELRWQISDGWSFYNNMFYNHDEKAFSKVRHELGYSDRHWNVSLSHLYGDSFLTPSDTYTPYTSYITSSARYTYNNQYSYFGKYNYDYENSLKKSSEIGFLYKKRCWEFGLRYVENNRPILTKDDASSIFDRYLYFKIVLKPLMPSNSGASEFGMKMPNTMEGS